MYIDVGGYPNEIKYLKNHFPALKQLFQIKKIFVDEANRR